MPDLSQFENAAIQVCLDLGENPHEREMDENGWFYPHWVIYAKRMSELKVMLSAMRQHGMLP